MTTPTRLRAEHLPEAMGLTVPTPRLGWTPPAGTTRQTAYRITASNGWDTGKVNSGACTGILYSGPALDSRSRFEWRVRTWNTDATGAETTTDWSEPMPAELGLRHPSDWMARWGDDYDGGHKAWVRWPDGRDDIVPGSRVSLA